MGILAHAFDGEDVGERGQLPPTGRRHEPQERAVRRGTPASKRDAWAGCPCYLSSRPSRHRSEAGIGGRSLFARPLRGLLGRWIDRAGGGEGGGLGDQSTVGRESNPVRICCPVFPAPMERDLSGKPSRPRGGENGFVRNAGRAPSRGCRGHSAEAASRAAREGRREG